MGERDSRRGNPDDLFPAGAARTEHRAGAQGADRGGSGVHQRLPNAPEVEEHPTLIPKFDPTQFAKETEFRAPAVTITDEEALEQARLASMASSFPTVPPYRARTPSLADAPEASVEIDAEETELERLGPEQQIAILRARLTPMNRVPTLTRDLPQLGELLHDPKTAYVLGFVDGILPLETIVDVTGLSELDTLQVLDRMVHVGVVVFRPSRTFHVTR